MFPRPLGAAGAGAVRLHPQQVPRAAITGQLPVLHLDQMALKQPQGPVERHGIAVRPLAPIQQGLAVALQQGHQREPFPTGEGPALTNALPGIRAGLTLQWRGR